ncbi:MAG TPA: SusC/RagA family TonB-linked outer membrane protein, partial [Chitinophagaceae bacterium]|nr:SusC/RagA family TonB-linked outer membrane protein [Chitinophagaceae bacterium]
MVPELMQEWYKFLPNEASGKPVISFSTSVMFSSLRKSVEVNQAPTKFGNLEFTQDIITTGKKTISPGATIDTLSTIITPVNRYNYNDYIFQKALGTDNNISISGGTDKTKYYASASYYKNEGIIKNTDFQRYSFRVNLDQTFSNAFSFNMGLNFVNSKANEKPDGNSFFSPMNSINIIGNFHDIFARDAVGNLKTISSLGRVNPISVIEDIKQQQETNRVLANVGVKFKPIKGLSIDYTIGIDQYTQRGQTLIPPYAYEVAQSSFGGSTKDNPTEPTLNGYASTATNNFFQINNDVNITYQLDITKDINSTTQVGYTVQYEKNLYSSIQGRGIPLFLQTVNTASTPLLSSDSRNEISVSGAFVQQNFKFKNQFFLTGAL